MLDHGVVVNLCITSFGDCTHPKHQETTAFSHVLPDKPFHRKDGRINLSSLHAQEGQESKRKGKAKEKKTQVTMEMASLRQDDVTQDMACLLYTSPSPRDRQKSRMPSSA